MKPKAGRPKVWMWADPIYDTSVVLIRGAWKPSLAWMDGFFKGVTEHDVGGESRAKCIWIEKDQGCAVVLWFGEGVRRREHLKVVAHEVFHASLRVLGNRHVLPTDESGEEAHAYWIAWLFEECRRRLVP